MVNVDICLNKKISLVFLMFKNISIIDNGKSNTTPFP